MEYDKSIALSNLPMLTIYFTSEKNAYGIMFSEWMDGEVLPIGPPTLDKNENLSFEIQCVTSPFQVTISILLISDSQHKIIQQLM